MNRLSRNNGEIVSGKVAEVNGLIRIVSGKVAEVNRLIRISGENQLNRDDGEVALKNRLNIVSGGVA